MTRKHLLGIALVAAAAIGLGSSAEALTIKFEGGSGSVTPTGFPPPNCFGTDYCGDTLTWDLGGGLTLTASPYGIANAVVQDVVPAHGGLGAIFHNPTSYGPEWFDPFGDEIDKLQGVKLTFSIPVVINWVRFHDDDHGNDFDECATFLFRRDGDPSFSQRTLEPWHSFADVTGAKTDFYFKYGGKHPDDFYIAKMDVDPVPEPGTMTLMGLGLLGLAGRARRRMRR